MYPILISIVFLLGILFIYKGLKKDTFIRFKARPVKSIKDKIYNINNSKNDEVFLSAGIPLSVEKYKFYRNITTLICIGIVLLEGMKDGMMAMRIPIIVTAILYYASMPVFSYGKHKKATPFKKVLDSCTNSYRKAKDDELMRLSIQLKNMIITNTDKPKSMDYIIEMLLQHTKLLRRELTEVLSFIRKGQKDAGLKRFSDNVGTALGRDFIMILYKLDQIDPEELIIQVEGLIKTVKEEKRTRQIRKQESAEHKMFMLASVLVILIMINYMYIIFSYLMPQMIF